jgi:hypothetical protein
MCSSCDGKSIKPVVVTAGVENADNDVKESSYAVTKMYVNNADGLAVKTEPNMSAETIDVLKHNQIVYIEETGGIPPFVKILMDEKSGWVLESYLSDHYMADDRKDYEGVYKFKSINIEIEDGTYVKTNLADEDDIYVKITPELDKTFSIEFSIETFSGQAQVYNDKTELPFPDDIPFYKYWAEMGGGGTYMDFYYTNDMILVKYHRIYLYPVTELGWDGETRREELKFELFLEKYESNNDSK